MQNYVYICKKLDGANEAAKLHWEESVAQIEAEEAQRTDKEVKGTTNGNISKIDEH